MRGVDWVYQFEERNLRSGTCLKRFLAGAEFGEGFFDEGEVLIRWVRYFVLIFAKGTHQKG